MVTGVTILGGRSFTEVSSYLTVAGPLQATQDPPCFPCPHLLSQMSEGSCSWLPSHGGCGPKAI